MSNRWVDLEAFRRLTAAYVKEAAELAGLEGVCVSIVVQEPSRRGREIVVEVAYSQGSEESAYDPKDN